MAVLQMQRVSICALKRDRSAILEKLQTLGVMEVDTFDADGFEKTDTSADRMGFEKRAQLIENALAILNTYAPEKKSLFASFEGTMLIDRDTYLKAVDQADEIVHETASDLVKANKEVVELQADVLKMENLIEALAPWQSLDIPMAMHGTESTTVMIGSVGAEVTLETIYQRVAERCPELEAFDITEISRDKDARYLAVITMRPQAEQLEEALRSIGFMRPALAFKDTPAREKASLEQQIKDKKLKIEDTKQFIKDQAIHRQTLQIVSDHFRTKAEKYDILGQLPQSDSTFIVSGYAAKQKVPAVEKAIGDAFDCVIDVADVKEDEIPPTILKNNPFSETMEGVVASYGLPKQGEFDPTTIMSFFYVFFFGMMLSDAAYGALIAIATFILVKKFPRMEAGMKKTLTMFMYCGISTMIWGILFGGYFGDVVDVVSRTFLGKQITIPALWFVPLNNPMKLLVYSMAFGLVHLFVGLGIKGYQEIKAGKMLDFFCDVILWYIFLIGLILMLIPSSIFASIIQTTIVFPAAVNTLAKGMALAGCIGLVLMSGRANKNPVIRFALGAYDVYNITGWLSDVLSYSRLLALGLATGVIAQVINQMGSMFGKGIVGAILFVIIFIIGHILNLAINVLGAYVHTNRLQYVEFFGKFYEGGGRPFKPFKNVTKYIDIKEDK